MTNTQAKIAIGATLTGLGALVIAAMVAIGVTNAPQPPRMGLQAQVPYDSGPLHVQWIRVVGHLVALVYLQRHVDARDGLAYFDDAGTYHATPQPTYRVTGDVDPAHFATHALRLEADPTLDGGYRFAVDDGHAAFVAALIASDPNLVDAGLPAPAIVPQ